MYYGKLNWIETWLTATVNTTYNPADTTKWAGNVPYKSSQKADGKYHKIGTKTLQSANTYGTTPSVVRTQNRMWSAKKTIGGQRNRQYYRDQFVYTFSGFLSCLKDSVFSSSETVDKDQRKYFCEGVEHTSEGMGTIAKPTSFIVGYEDFDVIKKDGNWTAYGYERSASGYITRNRKRTNIVTLSITWGHLTAAEAKTLIECLSSSQYLRVNFHNPETNTDVSKVMYNSTRNIKSIARGEYTDLTVTLTQV